MPKSCMVYPNLRAEMARKGITIQDIANILKKDRGTISAKLSKKQPLLFGEAVEIRNHFFRGMDLDYLFKGGA